MGKRKRDESCIYCGKPAGSTVDHVPPRNLFLRPHPPNLITVPACGLCNAGFSLDDEYFKATITMRADLDGSAIVQRIRDDVFRALDRPNSAGFRQGLWDATRVVHDMQSDGRTQQPKLQMAFDWDRLDATVRRTVKGLYYDHFKRVMPTGRMDVFNDLCEFGSDCDLQPIFPLQSILKSLQEEPDFAHVIHEDVFEYRYAFVEGMPETTVWLLTFFKLAWFLVFANWNPDEIRAKRRAQCSAHVERQ